MAVFAILLIPTSKIYSAQPSGSISVEEALDAVEKYGSEGFILLRMSRETANMAFNGEAVHHGGFTAIDKNGESITVIPLISVGDFKECYSLYRTKTGEAIGVYDSGVVKQLGIRIVQGK